MSLSGLSVILLVFLAALGSLIAVLRCLNKVSSLLQAQTARLRELIDELQHVPAVDTEAVARALDRLNDTIHEEILGEKEDLGIIEP